MTVTLLFILKKEIHSHFIISCSRLHFPGLFRDLPLIGKEKNNNEGRTDGHGSLITLSVGSGEKSPGGFNTGIVAAGDV